MTGTSRSPRPRRAPGRALLAAVLACGWIALPARAQDEGTPMEMTIAGVLTGGPTVTEEESRSVCLQLSPPLDGAIESSCEIAESGELERAGDRRYFWTRYTRTTLLPGEDSEDSDRRDTLREEEVVLFSAPLEGGRLTAEWHARYDLDMIASVEPAIAPTDDGALLGVRVCVNGTAGCGEEFLRRDAHGWRPVRQAWMEQLPDALRGRFWKGTYTSPLTLQGRAALYGPDDANCCPSHILYYRVRLDGDALVLRDHRVVPSDY